MAGGIGVLGDELAGYTVGLILTLALLVLHHAALQVEGLLIERAKQGAHAVGLQPERVIERRRGYVFEVVGAVVIGGAVQVGGAHLLHGIDVAAVKVLAAAEHEVFEQVREAGLAGSLVLRPDVIPDVDGYDGSLVIFMHDHGQAVIEDEFSIGDFDSGALGKGARAKEERCEKGFASHMGYLHMIPLTGGSGTRLAPVTFYHDVAAVTVNPAMRHPMGMRPWRPFPSSRHHGITTAIPILISVNPDVARAWHPPPMFDVSRWRNLNDNLGRKGAQGQ